MRRMLLAAASACLVTAACASVTDGSARSGAGHPSTPTPGVSYRGSYAPLSAITDPITASVASGPVTVSRPPSSVPPSLTSSASATQSPPASLPPPAVCRTGTCTRNRQSALDGGFVVVLWTASSQGGASGASVLELTEGGRAVWWHATPDALGGSLQCSPRPVPNCVEVDGVGAHASVATGWVRRGTTLVRTATVESDTPTTDPADLDHDGLLDVVTAINTYEPTYATGTVYWQTYRSLGTGLRSTGCTAPAHVLGPEPTRLLTGTCPS